MGYFFKMKNVAFIIALLIIVIKHMNYVCLHYFVKSLRYETLDSLTWIYAFLIWTIILTHSFKHEVVDYWLIDFFERGSANCDLIRYFVPSVMVLMILL